MPQREAEPAPNQQSTVTPPLAREIIGQSMSPFCPGLSLSACPSPSADSLRRAIVARVRAGETKAVILDRLYRDYGTAIRGATEFSGTGMILWLAPVAFVIAVWFVVNRFLRRHTNKRPLSATVTPSQSSLRHFESESHSYSHEEEARLAELIAKDS